MKALAAQQREPVRGEEVAQVAVRERAVVRRVAAALEAVELERRERIHRRELVVDEHAAAGTRHARELRDGELGSAHVVQRAARAREIEREVLERQRRHVGLDERGVRRRIAPRGLEQLGNEIDADDLPDERREREGERARAGARVERALVAVAAASGSSAAPRAAIRPARASAPSRPRRSPRSAREPSRRGSCVDHLAARAPWIGFDAGHDLVVDGASHRRMRLGARRRRR